MNMNIRTKQFRYSLLLPLLYPGKEVIQDRPTSELHVTWKEQPKTQMADQDFIVRSLKEKLAETQNELNQLKDKSDAYVSELNDAGKKQHECERRVQELHNNLEECRKYMRLSLFRLTHDAAAEKNKQTEEWLIDAEEFRQKAEEGQATFNNLKAETDYLLHNLKSREKQVDNLENMIYSLKDIVVKSQTELSQVQVNATQYLKDKEAAERAQAQYRESIHLMKEALHLGQRQKDISLEKIMSISQEEVELNKPISLDLDSYTKVFEHNTAPDDTKEEMNKILESIKLKDKQIKLQDQRITALSQLLEEAQMNINKIQKIANVHTNMEQEYEAKINKLQKELIESKKQIEDLQRVEKKQESKLLDPQSVEIIYENKTDAFSRETLELSHMELMLHQREQEVKNQDELITTLKNCLQTATQELNLLYKKVGLKIPLTLAEEDDKLFILESQLKAAKKEISEHIGKVDALQSEVTLSSNEQEMMFNNMFSTLQRFDKQVQLQNEIIKLLRDFVQKAQNEHQELLLKCNTTLVPKVSSVGEHKSMLQMKLKSYEVQLQAQEELINTLKESLEKAHQDLEEAIRETKSERRFSLQRREQMDSQKVVSLQSSVNQLKREMVKYQDMITTLEEKEQLSVSQSMDIRQALLQRKLEAQDRQIEAQGQMIQSYKDALKQTQQEFQELIKDADLTKQLEIQTLKSEGERKVEELQTVLKEVQLDLVKLQSLEQSKISSISQSQFTFLTSQMEKYKSQINTQDEMIRVLQGSMQRAKDEYEDIIRTNKNHQVSTDETKHLNQQRIRKLEDKLNETKEKLLSNQAQIEMLEREKSLPKSHSVQLQNTLLMSELEASERKVNTQAALISALEDSAKKIKEEYDQTLTKIKAEDRLTMEQLKFEEQYKIQGLQETLEKVHKQLEEQTSLPKSRSIIERNNTLKAALDSRNEQIDAQNEIIDALRNTIQKIKQDYGEIINKAQKEIKASSEAKEKEFEQRINELNNELTVANKKMNTYQAQIKAFEEKEVPVKSQSLEMLNALLTSKLETSEKKVATQSELINALQESIQRTKEENETLFERRSGKYVTFEDAQQMDDYKMQTLQEVSSKIQRQLKEQSHLPEATSSQLYNAHLVSQLETYDKQIDTQREMIALLQNSLQKAKGQLQESFQIKTQVRDNVMTESWQETEETIQELESSLLKVQDELTKYKELGEVIEKEGAIPDNQSFEILDILLASKLHTAEAQVEDQTELIKVLMETISLTTTESKAILKETKSDRRPSLEEKQIQDENIVLQLQTQLKDIQQELHKTINLNQENENKLSKTLSLEKWMNLIADELKNQTRQIKIQDELMSTLKETLNKTQKEFQNFLQTSNKDKKASLEKIEKEHNQKIEALQLLLQEEQANVHTYKKQIEMLEKKEMLPKSQSADLQVALLTSKLRNVEMQVEAKDQLIQVLKESIQTLRDEYNIMIKNTASEWRIVVEENQRVNNKKIQQLQDNLSQMRAELESSQDMIQTLEEQKLPQLLKSESLINQNTLLSKLECCENQLSLKNQDIQKLIYSLKFVQTELTQLQNIHQECGNATLAIKQLNAAQNEVQALKAKITTFEAQEETRKQEDKSEEILSLHSQLATATSNLEARDGVLSLKNQDIQKLIYSLKSVQTELTQLQNIHQECGNATLAIKQLNAAQDEVQALKAKITTFEAQEEPRKQEDKSEEILSLHSQLATATSNLKAREGVIANQEEMINILQESCKLHEKEIKELQTKTNKLVKEREQIDEEHKKLKYEYDGQQAQLLGLQEVLLATKQQLQDMQGKGYEFNIKDHVISVLQLDLNEIATQYKDCYSEVVLQERKMEVVKDENLELRVLLFKLDQDLGEMQLLYNNVKKTLTETQTNMMESEKFLKTSEATQTTLVDKLKKTKEEKQDLKTKFQMLELKMANLEILIKSFEQENTGLKLFVNDTSLRATDQDIMIQDLTAERDRLKHDLGKMMGEKQLLDAQLHQFEGNKINLQDKSSMLLTKTMQQDSQIWTLNCERKHLHQEVENLRATTSSLVKLEIQVQGLEREKSELRQRLNDSQIKLSILESRLEAVVAENDIIKKDLEGWANKAKTTGLQNEQIEILKVEKTKLQQKLDIYNTKITEQELDIKTLNAQNINLQQELDKLNNFITNLKSQPPNIEKEKVDHILKSNDSISRLSVKESDHLRTGLVADSTVPVNYTICLIEKSSDKNEYVKSLENENITLKEDKERLNSEITYLVYKLDATTYKNNELKSLLHQIRLKINGSNEGLKRAFQASTEQLEEAEDDITIMRKQLQEHDGKTECNTHELDKMRQQLRNLNRDLESLKFQICSKERDIKLLEEYRRKYILLRKVETQHVALKRDYNHLSLEHKRLLNILRTGVKDNIDYLKEQLIRLDADNTTLRRDNERLIEELDNALENYQEIRNQESSLSALLLHSENGKESLQKELCSLSLQVSQHTEINNLNTDHVNKLEGIISELNIYIDTLKLEMNTASHKHEEERYLLKEQNDELTRVNVELMNELTKLRDQIKHHEVQISKSERRVDDAQKEVDQCKEVIKVLREKIDLDNKRNDEVKELRLRLTQAELNYQCYLDKTLKQQETLIESAKREVTLQQHLTDREKELLTQLRLAQEQEAKMTELVDMLNSELGSVKEEVREKDTHLQLNITKLQTITTDKEKLQKDYERSTLLNLKLQQGLSHANMSLVRTMESMEEKDSVLNSLQLQLSQLTEACQCQDNCEHDVTSEQLLSTQKKAQRLTAEVGRLTKLQEASNAEITSLHEKIHKLRVGALSSNSQVKCAAQKLRQTLDENTMLRALIQQLNNENKYLGNEVQLLQATLHNSRQQDEGEEQLNTVFNLHQLNVQQERIIEQLTDRLHYKNNSFKRLDTKNRILVKRLKYFQQVNAMFSQALQNLQSRHELLIQPSRGPFSTLPKTSERSREATRSSLPGSGQNMTSTGDSLGVGLHLAHKTHSRLCQTWRQNMFNQSTS